MDKNHQPSDDDLKAILGPCFTSWTTLKNYLHETLEKPADEWNFPGKKYGWSFRIKSKKRNIIYFLPHKDYFEAAFVFGQNAVDAVLKSTVNESIKSELQRVKVYAEGRGIRIEVKNNEALQDIKTLIQIKLDL